MKKKLLFISVIFQLLNLSIVIAQNQIRLESIKSYDYLDTTRKVVIYNTFDNNDNLIFTSTIDYKNPSNNSYTINKFNNENLLISTIDSSNNNKSRNDFEYNNGKIYKSSGFTYDDLQKSWFKTNYSYNYYDPNNYLILTKSYSQDAYLYNKIEFLNDDKGNIITEKSYSTSDSINWKYSYNVTNTYDNNVRITSSIVKYINTVHSDKHIYGYEFSNQYLVQYDSIFYTTDGGLNWKLKTVSVNTLDTNTSNKNIIWNTKYYDWYKYKVLSVEHFGYSSNVVTYHIKNTFIYNSDITSLENVTTNTFNVFPNPVKETLNISFTDVQKASISLMNLQGNTIFNQNIEYNNFSFSTSDIPSGIYILKITTDKETLTKRIIISK